MKIELKNIQHSPSLSEETEAFTANLYINDVHAGYAKNQGHGGSTDYSAKDERGRKLINDAEQYCKSLPPEVSSFDSQTSYPVTLEDLIDDFLNKHLTEKDLQKFNKKMEKAMLNGVVFGNPEKHSFASQAYKIPLAVLLAKPGGAENLTNTIKKLIPELTNGTIILNTNIPEAILKGAGLQDGQYIRLAVGEKQQKSQSKRQGPKL